MVVIGVAAVLLVWFAVVNLQQVNIHFWIVTTRAPLIVMIVISCFLGAAIAALMMRRRKGDHRAHDG
jgi:uncharacterized integral membrane protein